MALTIGLTGATLVFAPPALADHFVSKTFHPTGGEQTYTIPAGVTKLRVVTIGGRGGKGADGGDNSAPSGRPGFKATADLADPDWEKKMDEELKQLVDKALGTKGPAGTGGGR